MNNENLPKLLNHDQILNRKYNKICITGDFNYPNINWSGATQIHESSSNFVESIRDSFLTQMVKEPTRRREGERANLLDLILVNDEDFISKIEHSNPIGKSDHETLTFSLYLPHERPKQDNGWHYNLNKADYEKMRKHFKNMNWSCLENMNIDDIWETIKNEIHASMELYVPKTHRKKKNRCSPTWLEPGCLKIIKRKHRLYKRFLASKAGRDYTNYIETRNRCKRMIKNAKREYEKEVANGSKTNPKKFWRFVQGKLKTKSGISPLNSNGKTVVSDQDKANVLNSFFSSVFTQENLNSLPDIQENSKSMGISLSEIIVTPEAVKRKLRVLDSNKAQGPDQIPARILKELSEELANPFCFLFNKSFEEGKIPKDWKCADVVAIFKKGSRSEPGNYRPVSLTCISCKVLESIIRDQIVLHMTQYNLYADSQHGFRNRRSCMSQLLEVMEDFTKMLDEKSPIDVIYLDFKKAFDSVPHERLLAKLKAYGINGQIQNWIRDFLSGRIQKVKIGESKSEIAQVKSGIPQGSILGPVLFTIFINDLPDSVEGLCKIFADDTKIYNKSTNNQIIQKDLSSLQDWSDTWQLHFNVGKCKVMYIGRNNPEIPYSMSVDGQQITLESCTEEKDLGVIFDPMLTFDTHINKMINKANGLLSVIRRSFDYLDRDMFLTLYKSLIRPHLEYGNIIWSPLYKRQEIIIENVQRRATKLLYCIKDLPYKERLNYLCLPSLKRRRLRGDLIETFKIFNNITDTNKDLFFSPVPRQKTRNLENKLFINRSRTNLRKNTFSNRIPPIWNNISNFTKEAPNVDEFKKRLDRDGHFQRLTDY